MKLEQIITLIDLDGEGGRFTESSIWRAVEEQLREAIAAVVWPPGTHAFTIYPERRGNGVRPIKEGFVAKLMEFGWKPEQKFPRGMDAEIAATEPGKFDGMLELEASPPFVVEWETGNISSSHRAMNKMALALKLGRISGGILVLPGRDLAPYLTDRIGNYPELSPYLSLYSDMEVERGYLGVIVVAQDAVSTEVPKIRKGTDGWALVERPGDSEQGPLGG